MFRLAFALVLLISLVNCEISHDHDHVEGDDHDVHIMQTNTNTSMTEKPPAVPFQPPKQGGGDGDPSQTSMFNAYPGKMCVEGGNFQFPISGHPVFKRADICRSEHSFLICKTEQCKCTDRAKVSNYESWIDMEWNDALKRCVSRPEALCTTSYQDKLTMECTPGYKCTPFEDKPSDPFQVGVCKGDGNGASLRISVRSSGFVFAVIFVVTMINTWS